MNIVFFEGFNYDNSDIVKLYTDYWSSANMNDISFSFYGRTGSCIAIANSPANDGMNGNKRLDLTNFTSPLVSSSGMGIGFWINNYGLFGNNKLLSLSYNNNEILNINTIYSSTTDSIVLDVVQSGVSLGVYDFKSVIGYTYGFQLLQGTLYLTGNNLYLEFYIDPKNTNTIRIRINGIDMTNGSSNVSTSISGFTNIDKISLFGCCQNSVSTTRMYDDFYVAGGNSIDDALLGSNVKIYRINPISKASRMEWTGEAYALSTNDGDTGYVYSNMINQIGLFNIGDLPVSSGSIGGIKLLNTARKVGENVSFTNIYASGDSATIYELGPHHTVNSTIYSGFNSFVFKNPQTNNDWTLNEINNMQLGLKKLS